MRIFYWLLFLAAAAGALVAIHSIFWQQRAIEVFTPTPARVLVSDLKIHRGKHTSYSPAITYSYVFQNRAYQSTQVLPFTESGSSSWARSILDRFPAGADITAYVDPAAPQDAVLVKTYSTSPYFISLIALAVAAAGLALATGSLGAGRSTMQAIPFDDQGWQLLLPNKSIRRRRRDALFLVLISALPTAFAIAHYLRVVRPIAIPGYIMIALASGLVGIELVLLIRAFAVARRVSDARLQINPAPMNLHQPLRLRAELDAYHPLRVTSLRATLRCIEHYKERQGSKTVYGTRTRIEKIASLAADISAPAGQLLAGEAQLQCDPAASPPSRDPRAPKAYPWFSWEIHLDLALAGSPDYHAAFPLTAA
jgi:hypothetical protein